MAEEVRESRRNSDKSLTSRSLGGFFLLASGKAVHFVTNILVLMVLARLLSPAEFGLVGAAMLVVALCRQFSTIGVSPAIVQRETLSEQHVRTAFLISAILPLLFFVGLYGAAPLVTSFFRMEGLTPVLQVIGILFFLEGISSVGKSLLQRDLKFKGIVGAQMFSNFVGYGGVSIALAVAGFGVWALVFGRIASSTLKMCILLFLQPYPIRLGVDVKAARELISYGGGVTLQGLASYLARQGDYLIVGRWLGASALGLYTKAYDLMVLPTRLLGNTLMSVLFPAMSSIKDETERLRRIFLRGTFGLSFIVIPASALVLVLAPEIVHVVLGPKWHEAILPLQILALGMYLRIGYKIGGVLINAKGTVYRGAIRQVVFTLAVLGGAFLGQHYGITGVATGVLGALLVQFVLLTQLALELISLSWKKFSKVHGSPLLLGGIGGGVAYASATALRGTGVPSIIILLGAFLFSLLALAAVVYLMPSVFLGSNGKWLLKEIASSIPEYLEKYWVVRYTKVQARRY